MEIIKNAFVNQQGAYYSSGGLIPGTQRIPFIHTMSYWQQANMELCLAIKVDELKEIKKINKALYIGRIPTHFGHFLLEGLPRICEACNIDVPIIGYITNGFLPEGILPTPMESITWVIKSITSEDFFEIKSEEIYQVEDLLVPKLPLILSHACSSPERMTPMIKKIVTAARLRNPEVKETEVLYLRRNEEPIRSEFESDPTSHISVQIARVSRAKKIEGKVGSNTHISLFAHQATITNWEYRGDFQQTDRNQLICDLIKTFNDY